MTTRLRAAGAMALAALVTGCGIVPAPRTAPPGEHTPAGPARSSSAPARPQEKAAFAVPAKPCRVLTARTRSRIGMRAGKRDKFDVACQWSNEPGHAPPYAFRDLKVTYDAGIAGVALPEKEVEAGFERRMADDYRQPSVFGGPPSVKGALRQVGAARAGEHFDEGYYVFFAYRIAGATRGEGRAVIRRGNVVVTIAVSGSDVPGRSVRQGKPIRDATARKLIDAVAGEVIAAVLPRRAS